MVTEVERDYMYREYAADPQARINSASGAASRRCSKATGAASSS